MSLNRSTRSNPNVIPGVDEPKRLLGRNDAPNESSCHAERGSRDLLTQETEIMEAWMQVLRAVTAKKLQRR